jgi:hypothetical protein
MKEESSQTRSAFSSALNGIPFEPNRPTFSRAYETPKTPKTQSPDDHPPPRRSPQTAAHTRNAQPQPIVLKTGDGVQPRPWVRIPPPPLLEPNPAWLSRSEGAGRARYIGRRSSRSRDSPNRAAQGSSPNYRPPRRGCLTRAYARSAAFGLGMTWPTSPTPHRRSPNAGSILAAGASAWRRSVAPLGLVAASGGQIRFATSSGRSVSSAG